MLKNDPAETFEHFFKPDVRKSGEDLVKEKAVSLGVSTDTQIDAFIRTSTPARVQFSSESIESTNFFVDCNCKTSKKGTFCKHIWAVLRASSEKSPDFFSSKTNLEKGSREIFVNSGSKSPETDEADSKTQTQTQTQTQTFTKSFAPKEREVSESQKHYLEAQKQRQSDYRKQMYQSQKERAKGIKKTREEAEARAEKAAKTAFSTSTLPQRVQDALKFFNDNGFTLTSIDDKEAINNAKRILSRVFHPDKGGTNDEMLTLLAHAKVLIEYDA